MKRLETHHWFGNPFDKAVILLKDVIEVFDLKDFKHPARTSDFQDRGHSLRTGQVRSAFINDDLLRNTVACDGLFKEAARSTKIAARGEQEIQSLAVTINSPI